jgi:transcriptional regulator with XRE-family HTH domain
MDELIERLRKDLQNENSRQVYADTITNALVSAQIKALREQRNLSQEELGTLIGTQQSGISRLEKTDYSAWKVETLRKLAKAFGVRLRIRFEGFGSLVEEITGFTGEHLLPTTFENDPLLRSQKVRHPERRKYRKRPRPSSRLRRKPVATSIALGNQAKVPPLNIWQAHTNQQFGIDSTGIGANNSFVYAGPSLGANQAAGLPEVRYGS